MNLFANFNKSYLIKWGAVCFALLVNPYTIFPIIIFFSFAYFKSKIKNIDLIILIFLTFLLYGSLEKLGSAGNIRFILIAVFYLKLLFLKKNKFYKGSKLIFLFTLFLIFILLHSLLVSYNTQHSIINLIQFAIFLLFLYHAINFKNISDFKYILDNIFNLYVILLTFSIVSFAIPSISYARNGIGFQGITLHPNMYGLIMAPFCALTFVQYILKRDKWNLLLCLTVFITLFLSQSRTSILSLVLGLFIYIIINKNFRQKLSKAIIFLFLPVILLLLVFYDRITSLLLSFLSKSSNDQNILDSVERSRGSIIETQIKNINENFLWGIGFKIPSDKSFTAIEGTNSIKYEKGNIFLATLEELGIFGLIFFLYILYILLFKNRINLIYTVMPIVFILTTAGESTLFSMGGAGFFIWTTVFINKRFQSKFI